MSAVDIGIDLGTANVIITMGKKGIVLDEPSVVSYNKRLNKVVAVGNDAFKMIGRTPEYIITVRPLCDGVISDHAMTESMITEFIYKVTGKQLFMPRIMLCIPSGITDVESRAVVEAAKNAGARKVYLIQEPIAALIGAGVDISSPNGNMVVDIGGGTTDIAVISLNGIVVSESIKMAGNKFDQAIVKYIAAKYHILIGEKTAEDAKIKLANMFRPKAEHKMTVKGRNLVRGLPEAVEISEMDIYEAVIGLVDEIVTSVKTVLEKTPPELTADIYVNGITLTGGGALLGGLTENITEQTGVKCIRADKPLECVAKGAYKAFELSDKLLDGFECVSLYDYK